MSFKFGSVRFEIVKVSFVFVQVLVDFAWRVGSRIIDHMRHEWWLMNGSLLNMLIKRVVRKSARFDQVIVRYGARGVRRRSGRCCGHRRAAGRYEIVQVLIERRRRRYRSIHETKSIVLLLLLLLIDRKRGPHCAVDGRRWLKNTSSWRQVLVQLSQRR